MEIWWATKTAVPQEKDMAVRLYATVCRREWFRHRWDFPQQQVRNN